MSASLYNQSHAGSLYDSIGVNLVVNTTQAAVAILLLVRAPTLLRKHVLCQSSSQALDYRKKQKIQENTDKYANQNTPPSSEDEIIPEVPLLNKEREAEARRRSIVQRKKRNSMLKRKDLLIANLKKKLASEQQKNRRLKQRMIKKKKAVTPKSKILEMAEDPNQKAELIKKALFGEVIQKQILDTKIKTQLNKTCLKTILSSPLTHKYKIWRLGNNAITYKKMGFNRTKYEAKQNKKRVEEIIHQFYEDDNNSRCAAGKKECITRKKNKKQKRYLMDSLKNLHQKFLNTSLVKIGLREYSLEYTCSQVQQQCSL
ncbi:hypothetical protein WA026_019337 [Henosepilachna vigintioctopunctata]|uniref:Uncharacterized protein n=1 Tax=Henosepilachna vigintioctopunctata TaxID=420089 RepID=A0AAW1UCL3_9CUCU